MGSTLPTNQALPAARSDELLTEQVGDETVVYDLRSKDVHCLSPLAAVVFEHCDGLSSWADVAERASERLGEPVSEDAVYEAVAQLRERNLLELPPIIVKANGNGDGMSRRDLAKKSAVAGAAFLSVPLISSIVAPASAWATVPIPTGCSGCGQNHDCASNHCCQDVAGKQCNQTCCVQHDNSCHISSTGACTVVLDVPGDCVDVSCPPSHPKCCCCTNQADINKGCPACPV